MLRDDAVVVVKGRVKANDDERQMICNEIEVFEARQRNGAVTVKLGASALEQPKLDALKAVILRHPGDSDVLIEFEDLGKKKMVRLSQKYGVDPASPLMGELRVLLGAGAFTL
jgi:DNA polymerase-3 subunit alpha